MLNNLGVYMYHQIVFWMRYILWKKNWTDFCKNVPHAESNGLKNQVKTTMSHVTFPECHNILYLIVEIYRKIRIYRAIKTMNENIKQKAPPHSQNRQYKKFVHLSFYFLILCKFYKWTQKLTCFFSSPQVIIKKKKS